MSNFFARLTKKQKYPRIMIEPDSGSIYLMTAPKTGTKLVQGATGINAHHPVGTHREDWTDWDMVDYVGEVTLVCS